MNKQYRFDSSSDKNAWETIKRLAAEAGWTFDFDEAAAERLRQTKPDLQASRVRMTREQFAAAVAASAGVEPIRFYAP